jgi:hypothetical protein
MGAALAPVLLIGGLAGGAMNAVGQAQSLQAQSANAAYQAQVAQNNAIIAGRNAGMETESGEIKSGNQELKTRAGIGKTLATQGASGVDVNVGSSAKVRGAEAELGRLDALTIRSDAAKKAYAYQTQESNFTAESGLDQSKASQASDAAPFAFGGSLLSSASTVGGNYFKYMQTT